MKKYLAPLFIALLVMAASASLGDSGAPELLGRLKTALSKVTDLSADFKQTTTLEAAGLDKTASGKVDFKRGGKIRWEYSGDDPQTIVGDGRVIWVHQVRDRTAVRREMGELRPASRAALDILEGAATLEKHFKITSCGPLCLELKPEPPDPDLNLVKLELDPKEYLLRVLTTEDAVGNKTRIELSATVKNKGLPDSRFTFTPPKGVDLFDGRGRPL